MGLGGVRGRSRRKSMIKCITWTCASPKDWIKASYFFLNGHGNGEREKTAVKGGEERGKE